MYHLVLHSRQLVVLVRIVELAHLLTNSVILTNNEEEEEVAMRKKKR